jgi:hypothetical protein
MTTKSNDHRSPAKSYTQLAKEFPNCKGYQMMADRERVMGVHEQDTTTEVPSRDP